MCGPAGCFEILLRLLAIGLSNGAIIALNAVGVTLIYGAVRMVNFAHGDLFALSSVVVATIIVRLGVTPDAPPLVLLAGLLAGLVGGMLFATGLSVLVERVAFRPFRGSSRLAPLIAGISVSFMLYQVALLWRRTESTWIPGEHRSVPGIPEVPRVGLPPLIPRVNLVEWLGFNSRVVYTLKDLLVLLLAAAMTVAVSVFLRTTRAGRALRAVAQDPETAQLCGVNYGGTIRLAFAIGGGLAGAAAFVFALYYEKPYTVYGAQSGLTAFAAAVLGGVGVPGGAFAGGLVLGLVSALSDYFLAATWTPVLLLAILIGLLLLRPGGLGAGTESGPAVEIIAGYSRVGQRRREGWLTAGLLLLAAAYPLVDALFGFSLQITGTAILIMALVALGLNLLIGYTGILDLGFAACFALGAYTAGMLTNTGSILAPYVPRPLDAGLLLLAGGAVAALFGLINGALTTKLRGEALAIATLAFGQMIPRTFVNLDKYTSGSRGIAALPPPSILGHALTNLTERYLLALGCLALAAYVSIQLRRSRIGRAWGAVSEDETAAAAVGIDVTRTRLGAFMLGAALAGVAGALFASSFSYVDPDTSDLRISAMVLAMVAIGGAGSVPGVILGALVVIGYDQIAIPALGAAAAAARETNNGSLLALLDIRDLSYLSFGLALYLTILLRARPRRAWTLPGPLRRVLRRA